MIRGGCQCGVVRYDIALKDIIGYACHCIECKKQTSSAFAISVPVPAQNFVISGDTNSFERPTDSRTKTRCFFCGNCGTRIYHASARSPEFITIKGGTLDDLARVPVVAHLWTKRKEPWLLLPQDVEVFETQPTDLKAWRNSIVAKLSPV